MPAEYKYGFLPKSRERALNAAMKEFHEAKATAARLQHNMEKLNERLGVIDALLSYGVHAVMVGVDDVRRKMVEEVIEEK